MKDVIPSTCTAAWLRYSFADNGELVDRGRVDLVVLTDVGAIEVEAVHTGVGNFGEFLMIFW